MAAVLVAMLAAGCRVAKPFDSTQRRSLAQSIISGWSRSSQATAAKLIEEYGPPDGISLAGLGWKGKGRWKRIVLCDANEDYVAEHGSADDLEQTVAYNLPRGSRAAVAAFSRSVVVSADGAELSARSGSEGLNFLALNLADQVARGVRDPRGARRFYRKTVRLAAAGKTSRYMQGLMFPVKP
jgi:hypothetical protein